MHKFLTLIITFFLSLMASAQEGYDNWFFKFFDGETIMYAKYFNTEGDVLEEASGSLMQSFNEDNKVDIRSALIFKTSGDQPRTTAVISKTEVVNVFRGTAEDSKGAKFTILTEILEGNMYKTVVTGESDFLITITGELKNDGKVYAKEQISEGGKVTTNSEVIFSKKVLKEGASPSKE